MKTNYSNIDFAINIEKFQDKAYLVLDTSDGSDKDQAVV